MPRPRTLLILAAALALFAVAQRHPEAPAGAQVTASPAAASGCVAAGDEVRRSGPTRQKVVALTFDDGPSDFTPAVLRVLGSNHVPGTFFEIGKNMAGREAVMRQIVAAGDEIGDHTWHHVKLTTLSPAVARTELIRTRAEIRRVTGFTPCLFRPPNGLRNSTVDGIGRKLGMLAILWSDNPQDFTMPGADVIYSRLIAGVRPGAILLMHDGGGNRSETVTALPHAIATLKQRGYTFATVSQLLGLRSPGKR